MLPKYRPVVSSFSPGVTRALVVTLGLSDREPLYEALHSRGFSQADVVLVLLRLTLFPEVEALIGHPILRLPARPVKPWPQAVRRPPGPDDRRIISVARNPRLPTTPSFQRYKLFRPGSTLGGAVKRGVTRKDIREAIKNQWIQLETLSS